MYTNVNYQQRILEIVARMGENDKHAVQELVTKLATETRQCSVCKQRIAKIPLIGRDGRKTWYYVDFEGIDHRSTCPATMAKHTPEPSRVGRPMRAEQGMLL